MNLPSTKTLNAIFAYGIQARQALEEKSRWRLELMAGKTGTQGSDDDLRMRICNTLQGRERSFYGVEAIHMPDGSYLEYLNTGDPYRDTLIYWQGRYRVGNWGDLVERYGAE